MANEMTTHSFETHEVNNGFSLNQDFSKQQYLTWCLTHTMEKYFPDVQAALEIAINAVEATGLADSFLGYHILDTLYEAQEELHLAGENASIVTTRLSDTMLQSIFAEKQESFMEAALADLSKAMLEVAGAIKASLEIAEANAHASEIGSAEDNIHAILATEDAIAHPWLRVPHWLKQIFAYKEELPEAEIVQSDPLVNPEKLSNLRGAFIKAYAKVSPAVSGEYTAPHCADIIHALYESLSHERAR